MNCQRYIIAPRRAGPRPPENWQDRVSKIPGINVIGTNEKQVHFEAADDAVEELRRDLGEYCHIEQSAPRGKLA